MSYEAILAAIDSELSKLQNARQLLMKTPDALITPPASKRGRFAGSKNVPKAEPSAPKKRTLSAEGRAKIAEAQRKRHAAAKRAAKKAAREAAQNTEPASE